MTSHVEVHPDEGNGARSPDHSAALVENVFNAGHGPHLCAGFVDFNAVAVVPEFAGLMRYYRQHGVFSTLALLCNTDPADFARAIADVSSLDDGRATNITDGSIEPTGAAGSADRLTDLSREGRRA